MSITAISWAWLTPIKKDPIAKLVLIALADYADAKGECWPTYETLASRCSVSPGGARLAVGRLERFGLVDVTRETQPPRYRLKIGKPPG